MLTNTSPNSSTHFAPSADSTPLRTADRVLLYLLAFYGAAALAFLALTPHFFLPAEDAVILFAYSRNLA